MESVLKNLLTAVAVLTVIISGCGSAPSPGEPGAVITVNGRSVLAEDISHSFEPYQGDSASVNALRDNIIARELFIAHARELGYQNDREVQRLVHERTREIMQAEWLSSQLGLVVSDEQEVREFWETLGIGVTYNALSLRDSLLMDSIAVLVSGGEDLSGFATVLGLDNITRSTGGLITIPDRHYANIMDLPYLVNPVPGEIVGPYPVPIGYRILQIDSVWTYAPEPFEVDSQRIASLLLARHREQRKQFVEDSLKTASEVTVNLEAMDLMASRGTETGYDFLPFSEEEEAIIAVTWAGGSRDIYSVIRNIESLPGYLPRETRNSGWLAEYAERLAMFDIEMQLGIEAGLDTVDTIARQLEIKELETLLDHYYEQIIAPNIEPDSAMIQEIYMEMREDNPVLETRVFNVLFLSELNRITAAEEVMESGGDMMALADDFEIFPPILEQGESYTTVPISRAMVPEEDRETLFSLEIGGEALVALNDTTALWFRVISTNPEHLPELDEIRDRVISAAGMRMETVVIGGLVDSLEAAYHPYIDEAFFQGFYAPVEVDSTSAASDSEEVTDAL